MRFLFKTNYDQDIKLFQHSGHWWSYAALLAVLLVAPLFMLSTYLQSQLVFVFIYAIVGVALMILTGLHRPGLARPRRLPRHRRLHGRDLQRRASSSGSISWSLALLTGIIGAIVGFPALRLHGIYLLIATISFAFIVEEILARWESVTHGNEGMQVRALRPVRLHHPAQQRLLLLPLPRRAGPRHDRRAQPDALADRPRLHRHPRQRNGGQEHGHQPRRPTR